MNENKPLLQEVEETFPFLENQKNNKKEVKKGKLSKEQIGTIIISILVLLFAYRTFKPFYIGFKYYNEGHPSKETTTTDNKKNLKEVGKDSIIVTKTYNKIDVTNKNVLNNLFNTIYATNEVKKETMSLTDKLSIVLNYLGINCDNLDKEVSSEEIKNASLLIFNEDLSTVERPTLSCLESDNFVIKGIKKAEADDNYLYIYEYFGYVVKSDETYNIYTNSLANESLTSYNVTENFTNTDSLKEYKWIYKKSSDNNYYFVSVTPVI